METVISCRPVLLRFKRACAAIAASLSCCLTCVLLLAGAVHALDPNLRVTQYLHSSWRIQDGSAPAGMYSIAQTLDGFLWFSSESQGMYRFDGVRFVPWPLSIDGRAISNFVSVYGDRAGGLWAISNHEVIHLKGGVVVSHLALEGLQSLGTVSEDADGSLWLVRSSNGISDAPLCHVTDRAVKCYGRSEGVPISPADCVLSDGAAGFWIGGQTALIHWQPGGSQMYPVPALKSNAGQNGIVALAHGPDQSLWVGINAEGAGLGLGQWKEGALKPFVTPTFDGSTVTVYDMIFDHDGNLWVGTVGKGVFRIRGTTVEHYGRTEGLSSDTVRTLFEDREGIVWAVTTNGIDSFRDPRVTTFSASEGLGKDAASGVLAARDGTLWVANAESLDHIVNGSVSSIRTGSGLPGHQVSSLLEDRSGNLWVGVDDGLYLFKGGSFRRLREPNQRPLGLVVGITEDIDGDVWAECGNPRKLVRIHNFEVSEEFSGSQIPPGHTLAPDPHGGIWIGTLKGDLVLFRHGALQKFPLPTKGSPVSHQIIAQADGSVLAGSDDGLVGLRQGKVQRMTTENGLPCNSVISFVEDKEKRWWFYTACGVLELPDSELRKWWANPGTVVQTRLYDLLDGAQPHTPSFNSAALSSDGRVWFANGVVVQMLDPSRLSQRALPAETYIESVVVDRKQLPATVNLKLAPHPRDLQFDYTSPMFLIPQRVKFRYRLDGYDHDWHDAGTRRQAFYTDLPPGKYTFRVVASNSDGVWDDTPARLDFSVAPAYYQTNWFRALCAVFVLALLWAAYQLRVRQLRYQFEMTLDARVGERTRIARELHDTLLQSFHGLLLRFQTVSQLLPDRPVEAKEKLDNAIDQAAGAITEGRDAVQGLRDSTVQGNDLALAISTIGEELAADSVGHRPAFRVAVEGQSRDLHPILRDEVYKIAAEALRNAFLHAHAKQVEVEIRYDNERFRLRVRDDGKGIDAAILSQQGKEKHFGLPGMRERASIIGGKLTVWSEVDAGTEVELRLPASAAYATARGRSWLAEKFAAKA
jgi:signal transduction histidine kinase/ligand-binding sensor domain-containing protein